jgi:hypothetical protein
MMSRMISMDMAASRVAYLAETCIHRAPPQPGAPGRISVSGWGSTGSAGQPANVCERLIHYGRRRPSGQRRLLVEEEAA